MVRDLSLNQAQIELKQHVALLVNDFKAKKLTLPSLTPTGSIGDREAASHPRTSSAARVDEVAFPLPAIFWSRIQATLVQYRRKGLTLKKRSC